MTMGAETAGKSRFYWDLEKKRSFETRGPEKKSRQIPNAIDFFSNKGKKTKNMT
jgi:hypothetical protein